jgi:uncharacterized repeat protein (TIGR01451 family)
MMKKAMTATFAGRILGAMLLAMLACAGIAGASQIAVNKQFASNSIALGASDVVTVTLQNASTAGPAAITAFSDDISTMGGVGAFASAPAIATTCGGSLPVISGTVISKTDGSIPAAVGSTPGSCTITFTMVGAIVGSGGNTILGANVTAGGQNPSDVTQTLVVTSVPITTAVSATQTVLTTTVNPASSATLTYTITNPTAGTTLTNVAFPLTGTTATHPYQITNAVTSGCGGASTGTLPPVGTSGTVNVTGATIVPGTPCTVTLTITAAIATTVNVNLAVNTITDTQGVTNSSSAASGQAVFEAGSPTVAKSFSPATVVPGNNTTLTITVKNPLTTLPLTNAAFTDVLPASLTVVSSSANANCGTPTLGGNTTGTFTFSAGTIAPGNVSCTITVVVASPTTQTAGLTTNTILANSFTGSAGGTSITGFQGAGTGSVTYTSAGGGFTIAKSFTPTSSLPNTDIVTKLTFTSQAPFAPTDGTFTDTMPTTPAVLSIDTAVTPVTSAGCGTPTINVTSTTISGSNVSIPSGGTCVITFSTKFLIPTASTLGNDTNTLAASTTVFGGQTPPANATATVKELPSITVANYVASNSGLINQALPVSLVIHDPGGLTDGALSLSVPLNAGQVVLAAVPNFSFSSGCPAGLSSTLSATPGAASWTLGPVTTYTPVPATADCTITYSVIDVASGVFTKTPGQPVLTSNLTGGSPVNETAQNSVTFASSNININKAFTPTNQIQAGSTATADITVTVAPITGFTLTQANGVTFSDTLPTNMTFATGATVSFSAGCSTVAQGSAIGSISGTTASFSNVTLIANNTTPVNCDITFPVTSSTVGSQTNTIGAHVVTSTSGITNSAGTNASLTVLAGVAITKTFVNPSFAIGGNDYTRFLITNSTGTTALTGGTFTDTLPSGLALASTTPGPIQAGDPVSCGGTITGTVGTGSFTLTNMTVAGDVASVPGTCVEYVLVQAATGATAGMQTNTIPALGLTIGGSQNLTGTSANVTLTTPPAVTLSKVFAPVTIAPSGASVLTISVANTASGAVPLTGLALTDTLPANITIAATPNASTTCGAGTVTAVAAGSTVALSGGSVGAAATCTISVSVTGTVPGNYTNTIPASSLTTTQGATNTAPATAPIDVVPGVTISKVFAPVVIAPSGTSVLTVSIANTMAGAVALSGMALTDTLPANITIGATPNASTTCGAGAATGVAGGSTLALTGGTVAAGATCTISVNVTGTVAGNYTNTIPASSLTTTQGATNAAPATAPISIVPPVSISKVFAPVVIAPGGSSVLTVSIANTMTGAVALSGMTLTDTLPANITVGATPNASTTCGAGTATAVAGGSTLALSGGVLAAGASCTLSVNVTGTVAGNYTNTIPTGSLTTTQGATNPSPATAPISIVPSVTISKVFAPVSIGPGGSSTLTISVANTAAGSIALSGMALTDTLPANVTIATTPNGSTTCGVGTVTAVAGGSTVALSGGTVGAASTCTISVSVTGTVAGNYTNTIPTGSLTTTQGSTNPAPATAPISIVPAVTLSKVFAPVSIGSGGSSVLTISVANTMAGAVALTGMALTDTLPANITVAATPGGATTCTGGTVTAVAGGSTVALSGGTVGAAATCTISVNVTGTVAGNYTNTIPTGGLTTTQGSTNPAPASAPIAVVPGVTISKVFAPVTIAPSGSSVLTISIANTAAGAIALSGMHLADTLPTNITVAATPNASTTCGVGSVAAVAGGATVTLSGGTVGAAATCTMSVNVTGTVVGPYTNTIPTGSLTTTQGSTNPAPATAPITIANAPNVTLSKVFAPVSIPSAGTSVLTISVANTGAGAIALSGMHLVDTLPTNITVAATPGGSTTCTGGTVTAVAGGTTVTLTGGTVGAAATCSISLNVTGTVVGNYTNTIPTGGLSTTQGASNPAPATAPISIVSGVSIAKVFAPVSIAPHGTSVLTISVNNTGAGAVALSGMHLTDTLPAGITIAATPGAVTNCTGGIVAAAAGGTTVALSGGALAAAATCTISVNVTGSVVADYTNTIPAGGLTTTQGVSNQNPATAPISITKAPGVTLSKVFAPVTIASGGTSVLTISIANAAPGAVALSGMDLTDALPSGITVAAIPNASTTCTGGTIAATAGAATVALSGGTLAAAATCTISVNVTGTVTGHYTNTIPAGSITTTQGATNPNPTTAPITIVGDVTLSKVFAPVIIAPGGTSVLTVTVANTDAGAVALSGMHLIDSLPAGITIAAVPHGSTTCTGGEVLAGAGLTRVTLSGGTLAAGATCTFSVDVTGTAVGNYTNVIPAGGLTTTQGPTNPDPATAPITISNVPGVTVEKVFAPVSIAPGETSVLTISIANKAAGAIALSGLALTDTLPAHIAVAATPGGSTTCTGGTVTATAGGLSVALSGGTIAAGATCTISVNVTGTQAGNYVNTIPAGGVTTTQGATNPSPATAPITIANVPGITLSKVFAPVSIAPGGTSVLTISIANTAAGAIALSGMNLTDALPAHITVGAVPNGSTTCTGGAVAASAGGLSVALSGASLAAGATCTISVNVTGTLVGNYVNTIPAGGVTTTQGATNPNPTTAPIRIEKIPAVTLSKVFNPEEIVAGATSVLTISIANTAANAIALSGMNLTDTLPANITVAAIPHGSTTCTGGAVSATAGGATVALSGGTIAAGATCTISVSVTGTIAGTYINTIPAGGLTTTQGATNPRPVTAPIRIVKVPSVTIAKDFSPENIPAGGTSRLTISIANTATNAIALTGMKLTDTLPANITIGKFPHALTNCTGGTVATTSGGTSVALSGGALRAGATCTISVNVTGTVVGTYINTIPAGGLTTTQGATNPKPVTAPIRIRPVADVTIAKVFAPVQILPGGTSRLTISIGNTHQGAIALTGMTLTDTLPGGITIATAPGGTTTCGSGHVNANAGGDKVTLLDGSLAAGATCTVSVEVTGKVPDHYLNTIPGGAIHTKQGATNPDPVHAPITIVAPALSVSKSSDPENATVAAGQKIVYTITVRNTGTGPATNATITDTMTNATLVSGSVRVDGNPAPDAVVTSAAPFGSVAAGATVKIVYDATVNAGVRDGSIVGNNVVLGSDQGCGGSVCHASPPPNTTGPAKLAVQKLINGKVHAQVTAGEVVTYTMKITNIGDSETRNTKLIDNVPAGVVPIAGTAGIDGKVVPSATVVGQLVTVPIGTIRVGESLTVEFKAKIAQDESGPAVNVVTITANGLNDIISNPVTITRVFANIDVTKVASANSATAGDRVDYAITAAPPAGAPPFHKTIITDTLPNYMFFASGSARLNGKPFPPVVHGQVLTWTLDGLATPQTIVYSVVIGVGAPPNVVLTNTVSVTGQGPPGSQPGVGAANVGVEILGSTIGSCYPITGRVYLDVKDSGRFEEGDIGVPGVYVYLDDGEYIQTDGYGRYNFPCVRPGMHALRLDESTLPAGVVAFPDRNIDNERSTRRLVHKVYDQTIIEDINFAVTGTPERPIPSPLASPSPPPPSPPKRGE